MSLLSLSQKKFIETLRKSGTSCQEIATQLNISLRLVYKWSSGTRIK